METKPLVYGLPLKPIFGLRLWGNAKTNKKQISKQFERFKT